MPDALKPYTTLVDFVTGRSVANIGAEENRQALERHLVEAKGFSKDEIEVDAPLEFTLGGERWRSAVDLVVKVGSRRMIAIKCAAGSLGSREREILAAARILDAHPIPLAAASDGRTAVLLDTATGKRLGEGLSAIPCRAELSEKMKSLGCEAFSDERRVREQLIFRTYDSANVNTLRSRGGAETP
jgi:hypothetical protein